MKNVFNLLFRVGLCFCCSALSAQSPENTDIREGVSLYQQGKFVEAESILKQYAETHPQNADACFELGRVYIEMARTKNPFKALGYAKKAKKHWELAVRYDNGNLDARECLMFYCLNAPGIAGGGAEKARQYALEIMRRDSVRGLIDLAGWHRSQKRYDDAFADLDRVLASSLYPAKVLLEFGRTALESGRNLARAEGYLKHFVDLEANRVKLSDGYCMLGELYQRLGKNDLAEKALLDALNLNPDHDGAKRGLRSIGKNADR